MGGGRRSAEPELGTLSSLSTSTSSGSSSARWLRGYVVALVVSEHGRAPRIVQTILQDCLLVDHIASEKSTAIFGPAYGICPVQDHHQIQKRRHGCRVLAAKLPSSSLPGTGRHRLRRVYERVHEMKRALQVGREPPQSFDKAYPLGSLSCVAITPHPSCFILLIICCLIVVLLLQ
jgi:hypothetical protein